MSDLDQQVRDISAGIGLPPVDSPVVPDPVIDCDCGRRWCWTDDAGWNAVQAERVLTGVDPITGITFKATLKFDPEPVVERKPLMKAELQDLLTAIDPENVKRLPHGFYLFARAIEKAHGIGEEE